MSDQNKYINGYIDNAVGMIHENVNLILQLKTQLRMANELVAEKDATIAGLIEKTQSFEDNNTLIAKLTNELEHLKLANESLTSKQSHVNTALDQISQMKAQIIERDKKIADFEKSINKRKNKVDLNKVSIQPPTVTTKLATDDF